MFSKKSKKSWIILVFSLLTLFAGLSYFLYLHAIFPGLVPFYGGGERFTLSKAENYTYQIPWFAYSRLHLTLQTNDTVELYVDSAYVCDCTHYDFVVEPSEQALILLKSDAPVSGMFTAWQEVPFEKQIVAASLVIIGLLGVGIIIAGKFR
jgi:hypothetical protein